MSDITRRTVFAGGIAAFPGGALRAGPRELRGGHGGGQGVGVRGQIGSFFYHIRAGELAAGGVYDLGTGRVTPVEL